MKQPTQKTVTHAGVHHVDSPRRPRCADRARFAAQAAARLGRLRLQGRARARRRVPGQGAGLRLRPPGQSDHRRARGKGQPDGGGRRAPSASAPAWRPSARSCWRCFAAATTSSPARSCSATPTACSTRWSARQRRELRRRDRRAMRSRRRSRPDTRLVFVETIANPAHAGRRPGAHRRALRARVASSTSSTTR